MNLYTVIGNVGGVQSVFAGLAVMIISYYSQISFMIEAIKAVFEIKCEDNSLHLEDGVLQVSLCDKLKLITGFHPNEKLKRLIDVGT